MEYKVLFTFENKNLQIQCTANDEMKKICEKFANKRAVNINELEFFYDGKSINKNLTLSKLIKEKEKNNKEILVSVEKKAKIVKCPLCICNDCVLNFEKKENNYQLKFYDCKYKHSDYKIFDEYQDTQKIDYSKIFCCKNKCGVNQKDNPSKFYKCLRCTQLAKRTRYYCEKCKDHDEKHITIEYDAKNYYCENDFKQLNPLKYYCFDCEKDLCDICQKGHMNHKHESYDLMKPNIDNIKKNLNEIKDRISDLQFINDNIKDHLDNSLKIFELYYKIGQDVIEKYELYNKDLKNHRILQTLNNLDIFNKTIMKDLNYIIDSEDLKNQINFLIDISEEERKNYKEGTKDNNDSNKHIDNQISDNKTKDNMSNNNSNKNVNLKSISSKPKIETKAKQKKK